MPWKNGGGVTHEIAKRERDGKILWRLSLAEVASDGPFSAFPGLSRILTVIEGAGIKLHSAEGVLEVRPLSPARFAGDTPVQGVLVDGPIHDFNVIYDGSVFAAEVEVLSSANRLVARQGTEQTLFSLDGNVQLNELALPRWSVAMMEDVDADCVIAGTVLHVMLQRH